MKAITFLKDSMAETKRLIKPSKKDLFKFTYTVCVFCFFSASILFIMDTFIRYVMQLVLK
ncbi:MAG: preprotein translocase subunit SecE [Romboutsia sp.]|nr:preprotein translocase subunit SecE [Romboutsia sp.]